MNETADRADGPKKPEIQPMETVPKDRPVTLHMPDGSSFLAALQPFEDGTAEGCWGWTEVEENSGAPEDWHDGVCWASNEDGKPSTRPIGWSA